MTFKGLRVLESTAIPKDELWLVPAGIFDEGLRYGETMDDWMARVMEAAQRGEIAIIKGLGVEDA